jgi:hypothetical protein
MARATLGELDHKHTLRVLYFGDPFLASNERATSYRARSVKQNPHSGEYYRSRQSRNLTPGWLNARKTESKNQAD